MEPLKEMFNKAYYQHLATEFAKTDKHFNAAKFIKEVTHNFEDLSLNQRLRNTTVVLQKHLPSDFNKTIDIMKRVITTTKKGYTNLLFPDFVSQYGHNHFDASMDALHYFTQFGSSEFAIREFLKRDFSKTIRVMYTWSRDKNHHVRRLSSEGSRPRLPWSFKLDEVINNPKTTQPILEALKADDELYVRKSVANHLNDISKQNTEYMLNVVSAWDNENPHTAWIIKHACRNLIKKGNKESLLVFGFEKDVKVEVKNLKLSTRKLKLGESLRFEFDVASLKNKTQKLVVDYAVHYPKKSGELSAKVFKLKELELKANTEIPISKNQVFKDFTTRKHYSGKHVLEILINGQPKAKSIFELVV